MTKEKIIALLILACLATSSVWGQKRGEVKKLKPRPTPVLQLENGVILSKAEGLTRANSQTVCAGDRISFAAHITGVEAIEKIAVKWTAVARQKGELVAIQKTALIEEGGKLFIDTTSLPAGTYVVTAETLAPFKDCEGGCTAYDSKTFVVSSCDLQSACFTSPDVSLTSATKYINPGETVSICSSEVTGGYKYGPLIPTWSTTAGKISGDTTCAKLETTGITPGTSVTVKLNLRAANFENCEATGSITFKVAQSQVASALDLPPCDSFKKDSARVDNVCKAILADAARQLEADPQARLIIDSYHRPGESSRLALERGKNVRDRLADGSIGVKVDANRLIVRPSGQTNDHPVVQLSLLPTGAAMPSGAVAVDVGTVTAEARRPVTKHRR